MTQFIEVIAIQTYIKNDSSGKEQKCKIQEPFNAWFHITSPIRFGSKSGFSIAYFRKAGKHWAKTASFFETAGTKALKRQGFMRKVKKTQNF